MLFGKRPFTREHFGLASFELPLTLHLGIVVFLDGDVTELVALGLTRLRQKDERPRVRQLPLLDY